MSNKLDIEIKQGEDFIRMLTIKDSAGVAVDITGFTFNGYVKETYNSPVYFQFDFTIQDQITDTGKVEMKLEALTSSRKVVNNRVNLVYDVEMNDGTKLVRILQGKCVLDPEVTK